MCDQTLIGGTAKYMPIEQEEPKKTNCIAISAYIQGNTSESEIYMDEDSAYASKKALLARYD
jgi:hypothetical protein